MMSDEVPKHYESMRDRFPSLIQASTNLGEAAKEAGPLDLKSAHLIQMAAAAAIRSEGAVHSHAKRAIEAGASTDEVYHAVLVLVSTIGFPAVAAAVSWIDDITDAR
jgi:4-carboxymuconolactone decarboxylase